MALRNRILAWIAPDMLAEVKRLGWMTEAMHDLHMVPIPYGEDTLEMAFQNCRAMDADLIAGNATIQDRQASLIAIYERSSR